MNLGTWEPDGIGYMSSYGTKAVSEVKVPPLLQIQHNYLYEELVSICIKNKIAPTPPPRKRRKTHLALQTMLYAYIHICKLNIKICICDGGGLT